MKTFIRYLIIALVLTTCLVWIKLIGVEVVGFLLSPFYGSYAGSFLLGSLSLGSMGVTIVFFIFFRYFQVYFVPVLLGLLARKSLSESSNVKIFIGLSVGTIAILVDYLATLKTSIEYSRRSFLSDTLSSLAVLASFTYIFYSLKVRKTAP